MTSLFELYTRTTVWFSVNGMRIIFIIAGVYVLVRILALVTDRLMQKAFHPDFRSGADEERERKETLVRIVVRTAEVALYAIATMMVLSEFGINIGPLIAGAGVVGLAIGFGAQQLVRDVISGVFILLENRYRVRDQVVINGISGIVDDLNLRVTRLRDADGTIHYIPNGGITTCSNLSAEGGRIHLSLKVSAKSDMSRVREIVEQVGKTFASDEHTHTSMRRPPAVVRIESFDADWVTLRVSGDAAISKQWETMSELKGRLKAALDEAGIVSAA